MSGVGLVQGVSAPRAGIRQQLSLTFTAGIVALALISAITISYTTGARIRSDLIAAKIYATNDLAKQARLALLYGSGESAQSLAQSVLLSPDVAATDIFDRRGSVLASRADKTDARWPEIDPENRSAAGEARLVEDAHYLHFVAPVFTRDATVPDTESPFAEAAPRELLGFVHLAASKAAYLEIQKNIFISNLVISLFAAAVLLLVLQIITRRITRPLNQLASLMQEAEDHVTTTRAEVQGPRDIADMAHAFNKLMAALESREADLRDRKRALEAEVQERERAERMARDSETRFRSVIENIADGILTFDERDSIESINRAARLIFGFGDDIVGQRMGTIVPNMGEQTLRPPAEHGDRGAIEIQGIRRNGAVFPMELAVRELHLGDRRLYVAIVRDITNRKQAEEALKRARDAALESARLKSAFLANISHEIRTPMNGVLGMTEMLLASGLNEEQREYAEIVHNSGSGLLGILNDLLDYSKIEAQKVQLEITDFSPARIAEEVVQLFAARAQDKGVNLHLGVEPGLPATVCGDPGRLRQVLSNLVGNAIKFTHAGEVVVSVAGTVATEDAVRLRFEVSDTGIGIDTETCGHLFQPFIQADNGITRKYGGTGLGLAISKDLVELMGGTLDVRSQPGEGSTFWFEVPFRRPADNSLAVGDATVPVAHGLRVLILDESRAGRRSLSQELTNLGAQVEAVGGVDDAMALLRSASERGQPYQMVFVDMMMPGMLGRAVGLEGGLTKPQLVLIVPQGRQISAALLNDIGFARQLTKPIRRNQLHHCIATVSGATPLTPPDISVAAEPALQTLPRTAHLLVVEDNPVNQKVATRMLQKLGLSVDIAVDGRRAIESLTSAHYDAVLMDCQMPEMDGYEVTRVVRALEAEGKLPRRRRTRLPIIAMTAHSHGSTMSQCLSAGMDDFLTKPVNGAALRTVLAKWLHVGVTATPGAVASGPHEPELPTRSTAEPALDAAALATMRELMGDGFDELVAMMLADAPARIAAMRIALATNDYAALRMAVHTLKSASANVSALMLSGMCEQLERRLGTSGEEGVASRVDAIDAEYTRVASALRGLRGGDG